MKRNIVALLGFIALAPTLYAQDAADTEAPSVDLTTPPIGTTLNSRKVTISGTATDNVGVTEVRYRIERSRRWRKAVLTNSGDGQTTFVFNARLRKRGHTRVYVRAFDAAKNESDTIGRRYLVDPNGRVTTPNNGNNGGNTGGDGGGDGGGGTGIPGLG